MPMSWAVHELSLGYSPEGGGLIDVSVYFMTNLALRVSLAIYDLASNSARVIIGINMFFFLIAGASKAEIM